MMNRYIITFVLVILSYLALTQNHPCEIKNNAFQANEKLAYVLTYNWFFVWTDVGGATLEATEDTIFGQDVYNLKGTGITFPFYDWFFQVRDVYQSWVNPENLLPVYYHRDVDEDGYLIDIKYRYDYENMQAYSETVKRKKPLKRDTIALPPCTYDVVSIFYHARNIDFSKYKTDEKIPLKILLDNEIHEVYIRYKGKEEKKVRGVGKFNTIKFTGSLVAGDVFKGGEDLQIWVTDDENRIPVWIETPIIVGTVKVRLVGYEGLKYPLKSMIKEY